MALEDLTTVYASQLEHVIEEKTMENHSFATAYFNFASDHKSIVFRISSCANTLTKNFQQKVNFDQDAHTKRKESREKKEIQVN